LYTSEVNPTADRPVKELKGFAKTFVKKGDTQTLQIKVKNTDLGFFDESTRSWKLNKGKYRIMVGSSSADIRLNTEIEL